MMFEDKFGRLIDEEELDRLETWEIDEREIRQADMYA